MNGTGMVHGMILYTDEMEIIKMWEYHQRIIFLTKIGEKYQLFYKSSGLAGYGTKGEVFPHLLLKASGEVSPDGFGEWMRFGWIVKYYLYHGYFREYRYKQRNEFPDVMQSFLDDLEEVDTSGAEIEPDPRIINDFCADYIKGKEDYVEWGIHYEV